MTSLSLFLAPVLLSSHFFPHRLYTNLSGTQLPHLYRKVHVPYLSISNIIFRSWSSLLPNQVGDNKPLAWKRYIGDIISLWHSSRVVVEKFIEKANKHHPTIKFTAEISCTDATFLDTTIYKGQRFYKESVLDMRTHFKPTETFQYTSFFTSCHPPGVKKGFVKGEALRPS